MLLTLFNLLMQTQKISWLVWTGAGLILVAGISLLVYFFLRLKKTEKEQEEDWNTSRSLFVEAAPLVSDEDQQEPLESEVSDLDASELGPVGAIQLPEYEQMKAPTPEESEAPYMGHTLSFASELPEAEPLATLQPDTDRPPAYEEQKPLVSETAPAAEEVREEPQTAEHATELLISSQPLANEAFEKDEESPLNEILAELMHHTPPQEQADETERVSPPESVIEQTARLYSPTEDEPTETPLSARVEQRPMREPFEPPSISPLNQREPFEPPSIELIKSHDRPVVSQEETLYRDSSWPASESGEGGFSDRASDLHFEPSAPDVEAPLVEPYIAEPAPAAPIAPSRIESGRKSKAAGAVLGLPTDSSGGPLIFGNSSRNANEEGVGSLSRYGKDTDKGKGHGGTIALLLVVLILGGGVFAYLKVPSVNSRVNAFVARMRGEDTPVVQPIRAKIFPNYKPETDKTIVKARGSVYNISDEPLEGLSLEVHVLKFREEPDPEKLNVTITPARLEKDQQGTYEFDYDAKQYPAGYLIKRLNSNNGEVKFTTPKQTQ